MGDRKMSTVGSQALLTRWVAAWVLVAAVVAPLVVGPARAEAGGSEWTAPELVADGPESVLVGGRMKYWLYYSQSAEAPNLPISVASNVAGCRRDTFTPEVVRGFVTIQCSRRAQDTDVPNFVATFAVTFPGPVTVTTSVTTAVSRRQQPDGMVRKGDRPFVGNDVYSRKATQVVEGTVRRGRSVTFTFRVQNDGPLRDRFLLEPEPYSSVGNERWRFGGEDVTDEIASTFLYTRWLEPGEHADIRLTLTRERWVDKGDVDVQKVRFESDLQPTRSDTVAIRVTVGDERL